MARREEIQKWHNARITSLVTCTAAFVAVVASIAAVWSSAEAHLARVEDERPFLAINLDAPKDVPDQLQGMPYFHVSLESFGKAPSRNVRYQCLVQPDLSPKGWSETPAKEVHTFNYILPTRSETVDMCDRFNTENPEIDDGGITYLVLALVQYEDDAHRTFRTPFCATVIQKPGAYSIMTPCERDYGLPPLK